MKCPNCNYEAPDGMDECPKCQLVFRKWEAQAVKKAVEEHAGSAKEETKESFSLTARLFMMFLICAGIYYLVRPGEEQVQANEAPAAVQGQEGPRIEETQQEAAAGPEGERWSFEGKVLDLARQKPVLGAKLYFSDPATGRNFPAETDFDGKYSVDLKPLEAGGYMVQIIHPDFEGKWWEGKNAKLGKRQRYQLAGRTAGDAATYSGKAGVRLTADFAIFPNSLTFEEQRDLCSAAPECAKCAK